MNKKTRTQAPSTPARALKRTPGIVVRSGLRGGDTETTEKSSTSKTSTVDAAGNAALPNLIIIK